MISGGVAWKPELFDEPAKLIDTPSSSERRDCGETPYVKNDLQTNCHHQSFLKEVDMPEIDEFEKLAERIHREIMDAPLGTNLIGEYKIIADALRNVADERENRVRAEMTDRLKKNGILMWNKAITSVIDELTPFNHHTIEEELWRIERLKKDVA